MITDVYLCGPQTDLLRNQHDADVAPKEVLLLLLQQIFTLVQRDDERRGSRVQLQRDLKLPYREVMAEGLSDR